MISCSCTKRDQRGLALVPWRGEWSGVAECRQLGLYAKLVEGCGWVPCRPDEPGAVEDLNTLYSKGTWNQQAQRWEMRT